MLDYDDYHQESLNILSDGEYSEKLSEHPFST